MMLLRGILAFIIILLFASIYMMNLRDVLASEEKLRRQEKLPGFFRSLAAFTDKKFHVVALAFPVLGVAVFNVLPIIFMILIAFTNYGGDIVPRSW